MFNIVAQRVHVIVQGGWVEGFLIDGFSLKGTLKILYKGYFSADATLVGKQLPRFLL